MIETGKVEYSGISKDELRQITESRYKEYLEQYRYYENSLLRPWRRIHLYKTLVHIYGLVMKSNYMFREDYKQNIKHINKYREDNYYQSEELQQRLNCFGYDRDTNRERIMYKQIYQECDELLKIIKHYD